MAIRVNNRRRNSFFNFFSPSKKLAMGSIVAAVDFDYKVIVVSERKDKCNLYTAIYAF